MVEGEENSRVAVREVAATAVYERAVLRRSASRKVCPCAARRGSLAALAEAWPASAVFLTGTREASVAGPKVC